MIDLRKFWGTDWDKNPALTDAMAREFETGHGVRLPPLYLELLRIQNGGYTSESFAFPTTERTSWAEDFVELEALAGIGPHASLPCGIHNLWNAEYMFHEWGLPPRQLLLTGDGHWWISLDYRKSFPEPEVWWLDTEMDQTLTLAPTFDAFIAGLRPQADVEPETNALRRKK